MKSKKTTFLLLAVVVVVWGLVGYRFLKPRSSGSEQLEITASTTADPSAPTDSLQLAYRDPFLGELPVPPPPENLSPVGTLPESMQPQVEETVHVTWTGTIKKGKTEYFLVSVNGELLSFQQGVTTDGMSVRKISPQEIVLTRKGKTYNALRP